MAGSTAKDTKEAQREDEPQMNTDEH